MMNNISVDRDVERKEFLDTPGKTVNEHNHFGKQC